MPNHSCKASLDDQYDFVLSIPETDDCVLWPFKTGAMGAVFTTYLRGKKKSYVSGRVDHFVAERAHGPGYGLIRQCNHLSCVNPRHLIWAQPASVDTPSGMRDIRPAIARAIASRESDRNGEGG